MAAVTLGTPHTALNGDPLKVIPIRNTATSGVPEDVTPRHGLQHICLYFSSVANANTFAFGRPIVCCAYVDTNANTVRPDWDPDDSTGTVTFTEAGVGASTGYLHIWYYPGPTDSSGTTTATIGTPHSANNGDPLRCLPIRNTASAGRPEDVLYGKEGLQCRVLYSGSVANNAHFATGRPVISAAVIPAAATQTCATTWDPDDATGAVYATMTGTIAAWCVVWSQE